MARQLPASLRMSLWLLAAVVVTTGVFTLLTWLEINDVVLAWAKGNPGAQSVLAEQGLKALREHPMVPKFVPLALVSWIVFALLAWVLGAFIAHGHGWARLSLTALLALGFLIAGLALANHLPPLFIVVSVVTVALQVILLFFLWRRDTSTYLAVE